MKKRLTLILATVLLVTVFMSISAVAAVASADISISANLSVSKQTNYVGEEVDFIVQVANNGYMSVDSIVVSYTRGGPIASYGELIDGGIVDIPVTKIFTSTGEFGVTLKVTGSLGDEEETVTTNTVTVIIVDPPTPTPAPTPKSTPEPTPEPTLEPTPESTLEPTQTPAASPTSAEFAALDEDISGGQVQSLGEKDGEQRTESTQETQSNTTLIIILAALLLLFIIGFTVFLTLHIVNKKAKGKK